MKDSTGVSQEGSVCAISLCNRWGCGEVEGEKKRRRERRGREGERQGGEGCLYESSGLFTAEDKPQNSIFILSPQPKHTSITWAPVVVHPPVLLLCLLYPALNSPVFSPSRLPSFLPSQSVNRLKGLTIKTKLCPCVYGLEYEVLPLKGKLEFKENYTEHAR